MFCFCVLTTDYRDNSSTKNSDGTVREKDLMESVSLTEIENILYHGLTKITFIL